MVQVLVNQDTDIAIDGKMNASPLPHLLVARAALFGGVFRGHSPARLERPTASSAHTGAKRIPILSVLREFFSPEGAVARRDRVLGRALENGDVLGLLRYFGNRLDARRARADHTHALARERHGIVGPPTRMMAIARKVVDARVIGLVGDEERAHRADQKLCPNPFAGIGFDCPPLRAFVITRIGNPSIELNISPKVKAIGEMLEIGEDVGLGGLGLGPFPLVHQLLGERVGVERAARHVDSGAGVTVIPPGATYAPRPIEGTHREAHLVSQMVNRIEPPETRPDDNGVAFTPVLVRLPAARRTRHGVLFCG